MTTAYEVTVPSDFDRRTILGEIPGGPAVSAAGVVPTITTVGAPFTLKVALADEQGYPAAEAREAVILRGPFGREQEIVLPQEPRQPAVAAVHGVAIHDPGIHRFELEYGGRAYYSNPTSCGEHPRTGIYWGDPHVHTVLSQCHPERCRSLPFAFASGRHFAGLDFVGAADHVSNGRCELARWKEQVAVANAHDDSPHFVTLPAYEASFKGGAGGDNNVYMSRFPDLFVDDYDEGTVKALCEKLARKLAPGEFFVVPHHTTRTGKHGEIPAGIYPGEQLMPVVEIHSKWGTSEYRGNPNPLHKIHPGPSYVVDLLNAGLKLGFIGGTDTHSTMAAGFGDDHLDRLPGMTAVLAGELTRQSVYDAIRTRNCYAASLERVYLDVEIAGHGMGTTVAGAEGGRPRRILATVAARSDISHIDVVRNGRTVFSVEPAGWSASVDFTDADDLKDCRLESECLGRFTYYYVRVTCASGAQAWSSPVWFVE